VVCLGTATAANANTVTIGAANPAGDPGGDCGLCQWLQTAVGAGSSSYTVPSGSVPWVLTSFTTREDGNPTVGFRLLLAEPAGGSNYTLRFRSEGVSTLPNQLNTYVLRIPVEPGWVLGLNTGSNGGSGRNSGNPGDVFNPYMNSVVGTTAATEMPFAGSLLNIEATLESDCDGDGLGDDSQDASLDCAPPETTITKHPKDKTKKKKAKFKFTSNEPGSTFECSLDGAQFAPCSSPDTLKVKKGKHSFEVKAHDAAGNVDGSPASDNWKVKKKRKK
jgi:hypothetical protein